MALFRELNNLMVKYGFVPNKKMGQNFVINEELLDKMKLEAGLKKTDVVLEVGPGTGFLTKKLLEHSKVIACELDSLFCKILREKFKEEIESKKLVLLEGNFLEQKLPKFNKVVCLPPYTISSGLLFKLLEHDFDLAVLVLQREFVFKCLSKPGFKEFCPLAVMLDYYFDSKILIEKIAPASFFPSPKSFSSLIKLSRKKGVKPLKKRNLFKFFLKSVFRYKNKNIYNALLKAHPFIKTDLAVSHEKFNSVVSSLSQKDLKVYLLETSDFVKIFEKLF